MLLEIAFEEFYFHKRLGNVIVNKVACLTNYKVLSNKLYETYTNPFPFAFITYVFIICNCHTYYHYSIIDKVLLNKKKILRDIASGDFFLFMRE